jgi:DNA-directed RNA polymerase II subunit RPB2
MDNQTIWKIINSHFEENPQALVSHHLDSYNDFFRNGVLQLLKEKNPVPILSKFDETIKDYKYQCLMYFGGKDGTKVYYGKPVIHDAENPHYMYPNEARLRNMTYAMSIHYDIELEFVFLLAPGESPKNLSTEIMNELVTEQLGGGHNYEVEFADNDFGGDEFMYAPKKENYKVVAGGTSTLTVGDAPVQQEGGAQGKRATKKPPVKITTALAALLRETNEQSIVSHTKQVYRTTIEKVLLGRFPIMVQSDYCILNGVPRDLRFNMGECRNDPGGYFIIDGKEKTVVMQEKFGDNMLYIEKLNEDDTYSYSANIRSVSENVSKPVRTLAVKIVAPTNKYTNRNIVVNIPNVREPVPLFIVFRALGILSDKEIIEYCLLDCDKYSGLMDMFIPSVHDAGSVLTQQSAILYIAHLTKYHTVSYGLEILNDFFLPHVGESNYIEKAYFLGNIVFQLLCVASGLEAPTDRDNYKYKRVEVVGSLIHDLFREYYTIQQKHIHLEFERLLYNNQDLYSENLHKLVFDNYREIFKTRIVDDGFKKAFKGNWGAQTHTKRIGAVQDLNRLSFNSMISHLRKTNLPLDSSVKLVGPRVLHNSHWGFIDPIDTPDGGNIGLHKTLAIMTTISRGASREPILLWLREHIGLKRLEECTPLALSTMTKVYVNGLWAGAMDDPINYVNKIRLFRRNALLPIHMSVTFDYKRNAVFIYTDAGRLCRPIFYKESANVPVISYEVSKQINKLLREGNFTWTQLVTGFNKRKSDILFEPSVPRIYHLADLYEGVNEGENNPAKMEKFLKDKAVLDYIDPSESENTLIAINTNEWEKDVKMRERYTHMEIHESLIFGVMCNQIIFPENNPPTRNSFSCGQSKQAVSMYHTNHQVRMDKTAVVLNNGQVPLVKSRYMEYINHEENPYGENAIVAIMCYTGYNVEDAILINEGAIQRGLFRTTYYTTYEAHEESSKKGNVVVDKHFANIESLPVVHGTKAGYDYSKLDATGLIQENVPVDDKTMLIGLTSNSVLDKDARIDLSVKPKKGQLGMVDKTFITEGEEGERIAKVRIRDIRIPSIGDKMASRAGQKGTVGMIIRECDMPFTADGVRPDLIINPHALPTRMTIGQLVECITGKACAKIGAFSDCTAFNNKGSKIGVFGELLPKVGFHSSGNEILYNGMTGEQIETEIFIGPTYYMRLKHMVKDKINYRATGPRAALTRQPVSGRANDGGLRIGEMERDVLISHGISNFCRESMMERGDKYFIAVCNQSGMIAIYNSAKNLFLSPMVDGPLQFSESADGTNMVLNTMSRFGRSFSILSVPYSFKLLMQELQTMNIQMRIITEDNIDQIESMSYSDNFNKLTYLPKATLKDIATMAKRKQSENPMPERTPVSIAETRATSIRKPITPPGYMPNSPGYMPNSPGYMPNSPGYMPNSPGYMPNSPGYMPNSPGYMPNSPDYMPNSQNYNPESPPYAPESPPYAPESPPYAPGYKPEENPGFMSSIASMITRGGGVYNPGDTVYYVKSGALGLDPYHPWTVKKTGDRFYTIETYDAPHIKDNIQVVDPYEIYLPNEMQQPHMMPANYDMPMASSGPVMPTAQEPRINISPIIKIVNGPDNSTNSGESSTPTATATVDGVPVQTVSTNQNNIPSLPNKINTKTVTPESTKPESEKSFLGGMIDFGKSLLIKKV